MTSRQEDTNTLLHDNKHTSIQEDTNTRLQDNKATRPQ